MRTKFNKVLFVAPLPPPLGGQAEISKTIFQLLNPGIYINTNNSRGVIANINCVVKIVYFLSFFKVDAVYFTCSRTVLGSIKDLVLIFFSSLRKIKIINHVHGNDFPRLFSTLIYGKIVVFFYKKISYTIFVTNYQKSIYPEVLKNSDNNCVIYNSIGPELNCNLFSHPGGNKVNLLFLSNILYSKGVLSVLNAFEKVAERNSNIYLDIAGDFASDGFMKRKKIKEVFFSEFSRIKMRFGSRINYHGEANVDSKVNLYKNSDIFLFPSFYKTESFGIVNIEAMYFGNVIIANKLPFIDEIITDLNGSVIDTNDIDLFAKTIEFYAKNLVKLRSIQERNHFYAKDKFSFQSYINNFSLIIKNMLT